MNFIKQLLNTYNKGLKYDKTILDLNNYIEVLNKDVDSARLKTSQCQQEVMELQDTLSEMENEEEVLSDLDSYLTSKKAKVIPNIAYKNKRYFKKVPISVYLNELIQRDSYEVLKVKKMVSKSKSNLTRAKSIGDKVSRILTWSDDKNLIKSGDYYVQPNEALVYKKVDCFAGYEKIYTKEGVKKIKDIKVGDIVLSYDFNKKEYVYKKVTKHWSKGELEVNRVCLRNGQHFDLSENHPMWNKNYKKGTYDKVNLSDIDLSDWRNKKVPVALKIPYTKSKPKFPKDLYLVMGHYLAEGWYNSSVHSSGYELTDYIIPLLEKHNIPFTEYTNNSGVPCITILKCEFRDYLVGLKRDSFDITVYEEVLSLPEDYLEAFIYGAWLGDGTKNTGTGRNKDRWVYSTSSEKFADDIVRIMLQLGRPVHKWKQLNHGGVGNKPIYRLTYNPKSHFLDDKGFDGLSETSIREIKKLGKVEMFDLTVEDTHTVVMHNGLVTHQCEDHAFVNASMDDSIGVVYGFLTVGGKKFGHAWNCFVHNDKLYYLETTGNTGITLLASNAKKYEGHYIITKDRTYQIGSGVNFGEIAKPL